MSKIACVWADLASDTKADIWYEDEHVPNVVARIGGTARNVEQVEENIFKEVASIHGKYMTLYDLKTSDEDIYARIHPTTESLPANAQIDTRIYNEYATWYGEEWQGHFRDVQMFIIVLWQPLDAVHDAFVEWFRTEFAAGMQSPDLLRLRIFKLQHASMTENGKTEEQKTKDVLQYMTVWEFGCEDLPWELMVYLGSSEGWRYYVEGGHLRWQIGQYLVNRMYPEDESADCSTAKKVSTAASN